METIIKWVMGTLFYGGILAVVYVVSLGIIKEILSSDSLIETQAGYMTITLVSTFIIGVVFGQACRD